MHNIDFDWMKILTLMINEFSITEISETCEISIVDIRRILTGLNLEPRYSSGALLINSFRYYFPGKIKQVELK